MMDRRRENGAGDDTLNGGDGAFDMLPYLTSAAAVSVDLGAGIARTTSGKEDVLSGLDQRELHGGRRLRLGAQQLTGGGPTPFPGAARLGRPHPPTAFVATGT
jgi:hypothetical protein